MPRSMVPFVLLMVAGCSPEPVFPEDAGEGGGGVAGAVLRRHCVVAAHSTDEGGDEAPVPRPPEPPQCFHQFSEAIAFATGGRVLLPAHATPADVDEALLRADATASAQASPGLAQHVIAVEFADPNYGGGSLTVQSPSSCESSSISLSTVPSVWNDTISSARVFGGCNHAYHYEHGGMRGAQTDCGRGCAYVGDPLNDRTSSLRWTK